MSVIKNSVGLPERMHEAICIFKGGKNESEVREITYEELVSVWVRYN